MLQEFVQEIENIASDVVNQIHTAIPAKIVSYDAGTGSATVQPFGTFVKPDGTWIDYPQVSGVPVVFPQCPSKDICIAFPVNAGDSVLLVFSEVELDAWLYKGKSSNDMKYALTSAVAIPGLCQNGNEAIKEACTSNAVVVKVKDTKLTVSDNGIAIRGDLKVEGNISSTGTISGVN